MENTPCYKCGIDGHLPTVCLRKFKPCGICNSDTHRQVNCHAITYCLKGKCSISHHSSLPCDLDQCKRCGLVTHKTEVCTEIQCFKCHSFTHTIEDCDNYIKHDGIRCYKCNVWGHKSSNCPTVAVKHKIKCFKCGQHGHKKNQCDKKVFFLYV